MKNILFFFLILDLQIKFTFWWT